MEAVAGLLRYIGGSRVLVGVLEFLGLQIFEFVRVRFGV